MAVSESVWNGYLISVLYSWTSEHTLPVALYFAAISFTYIHSNTSILSYIIFLIYIILPSVRLCAPRSPLPSDRLRSCDRCIRCQWSLVVKPLNSTRDLGLPVIEQGISFRCAITDCCWVCPMTVNKLTYACCQMTQRDGNGPEADAIALCTSTLQL